jgi:hypothetical protein
MVFFIPWRVVAKESGAAHFGFGGAMLFDLPQTARTTLRSPPFGITKFLPDASARAANTIPPAGNVGERARSKARRVTRFDAAAQQALWICGQRKEAWPTSSPQGQQQQQTEADN